MRPLSHLSLEKNFESNKSRARKIDFSKTFNFLFLKHITKQYIGNLRALSTNKIKSNLNKILIKLK